MSKDNLGDRMKDYYEGRSQTYLLRRSYTIIRIDGKAFHSYTEGLKRPFDDKLISDMDETTKSLVEEIQGAKLGYVQSDEISLLLTDFDNLKTDAYFDGNIQKIVSVTAALATYYFNKVRGFNNKLAVFDSRVFQLPTKQEVINYFIWRQQDASRNSIASVAQSLYTHKELKGKNTNQQQELIFQKGINWNNYPSRQKRGGLFVKPSLITDENRSEIENLPIFSKSDILQKLIINND
jgi:tRNA(His) 5'-end guanylyltransferase